MKVAINRCWGGFGISPKALLKLIEMNSELVETHTHEWSFSPYEIENETLIGNDLYSSKDYELHNKERTVVYTSNCRDYENRSHPDLIKVIELLGETEASGRLSSLDIREIPDGVDYYIEDYDGMESIHENHRSW